jgi:hypothetical protein
VGQPNSDPKVGENNPIISQRTNPVERGSTVESKRIMVSRPLENLRQYRTPAGESGARTDHVLLPHTADAVESNDQSSDAHVQQLSRYSREEVAEIQRKSNALYEEYLVKRATPARCTPRELELYRAHQQKLAEEFPFLENRRMAECFWRENQSHEQHQGAETGHNPVSSAERSGRSSLNPQSGYENDDDVASANNPFLKPAAAGTKRTYVHERDISPTPSQDEQFRRLEISKSLARQKAEGPSSKKRRIRDDSSRESTLEPIDETSEQEEREIKER